ncbi:hypothetical protein [Aquimarina algiphila]|uniref:hypothetical protein n=1 Tax=Aquimarina algiphila TaxID=2047982 RepID=UPI00232F603D|nr:hypothetical protein [Aquimarina algiphila]
MDKLHYICLLLFSFFTLQNCTSQKAGTKNISTNTTIPYETIKDSAYCKPPSSNNVEYSFYNLPFFKTDREVVLFNGGNIYQGFSFFNRDSLQIQLKKVIQDREEWCVKEDTHSGLIELSHEVTYNEKDLVSFKLYYAEYGGSIHTYTEYYNYSIDDQEINIRTDKGSILNIFKKEKKEELTSKMNEYILKNIKNTLINGYDDFGEKISVERKRNIEESINNGDYTLAELPTEWAIEINGIEESQKEMGISFHGIRVPSIITDASNDYSIFFTFKELHPYIVESFKKHM